MFCSKCGKPLAAEALFCSACGAPKTISDPPPRSPQSTQDLVTLPTLPGNVYYSEGWWRSDPPNRYGPYTTREEAEKGIRFSAPETAPAERKSGTGSFIVLGVLGVILIGTVGWGLTHRGYVSDTPARRVSPMLSGQAQSYEIVVTGTAGIPFHGSYMTMAPGGSSSSQSVEGVTPQSYFTTGVLVSMSFQKQGAYEGTKLRVEIKSNGAVRKSAETNAAYGLVAVATD